MKSVARSFPVQTWHTPRDSGKANEHVYMAAYEVYCHCFGEQKAMIEDHCRGGFSVGELVAFLYARAFPKSEWRARVDEALLEQRL